MQKFKRSLSWLRRRWWLVALGLVGVLVLLAVLREEQIEASLATVQRADMQQYLLEDGKTRLDRTYTLTLPVNASIRRLELMEGDWLEKGQVVVQLHNYPRQQELAGLQSRLQEITAQSQSVQHTQPKPEDYASAQARIREVEYLLQQSRQQREGQEIALEELARETQRQQILWQEKVLPEATYLQSETQYRQLQKRLQQALSQEQITHQNLLQARLALQKLQASHHDNAYQDEVFTAQRQQVFAQLNLKRDELQQARLIAPISGPVLEIQQNNAGPLAAGTPLLTLGDLSSLSVEADVLSEEIHQLRLGQPVEMSGKALQDQVLRGQIARIFPSGFTKLSALGVEQQRVKVLIAFDNQQVALLPGTALDLKLIIAEKKQTLVIPERALFRQGSQWQVLKLDADRRLQLQDVLVGLKNDSEAEILRGLQAGDQIVQEMDNRLKVGVRVQDKNMLR